MPAYPVMAENPAPSRKAMERPILSDISECVVPSAGRKKKRTTVSTPMKMATVRNCRER